MTDFHLTKWYLDAVDENGNAFIGYHITLHWKHIMLHGYQLLRSSPKTGTHSEAAFLEQPIPIQENGRLVWQPKNLSASWVSEADSIKETLYESSRGAIVWECIQPKARATISFRDGTFSGWGYTERIDITLPVWHLPFRTLYWGRGHSDHHYAVWIKWVGDTQYEAVWHDWKRETSVTISDRGLSAENLKMEFGNSRQNRQGKPADTIRKPFAGITKLFPKPAFLMDERKWQSKGTFETASIIEPATFLYETVLW